MTGSALSLRWVVNPPVGSVADAGTEIGVLLEVTESSDTLREAAPLRWAVAQVGALRGAHAASLNDGLRAAFDVAPPRDDARWLGPAGPCPLADVLADPRARGPVRSLAAALRAGAEALAGSAPGHAKRLLVALHSALNEPYEDILAAAAALHEHSIGVDVLCTHPSADLGLLTRLANMDGGEVLLPDPGRAGALGEMLAARIDLLRAQRVLDVRLTLHPSPLLQPLRLFRVAPSALFLRAVRPEPDHREVVIDVGPMAPGARHAFLLTAQLPRRRIGRYRILEIIASHATDEAAARVDVLHQCTLDPAEAAIVEAEVRSAQERVEGAAWVEEVAKAYADGDARRVSVTLDRLVRYFAVLTQHTAMEQTAALRIGFLRTGTLSRTDLNRLRRLAAHAASPDARRTLPAGRAETLPPGAVAPP